MIISASLLLFPSRLMMKVFGTRSAMICVGVKGLWELLFLPAGLFKDDVPDSRLVGF